MNCRICGFENISISVNAREMMYGTRAIYEYCECSSCGCLQIKDFPVDLKSDYGSNYYSFISRRKNNFFVDFLYSKRDRYSITRSGFIGRILYFMYPKPEYGFLSRVLRGDQQRILDVGCGAGALLQSLQRAGFRNLCGVDPYIGASTKYGNGVQIFKCELSEFDQPQDIVMFNHSLEHIVDQRGSLLSASRLISDSGVIIVRVPTVSSFAWRFYRENWVQLDAPRHLYLHSISSFKILAENCGLYIADSFFDSTGFQFWGSEQYKKDIHLYDEKSYFRNRKASDFEKSEILEFESYAGFLNKFEQGDQVVFYLRKKPVQSC